MPLQPAQLGRGTAAGPGRTSKRTLAEALMNIVDPDVAARLLWERAVGTPDHPGSDMLLRYYFDRILGYPHQSMAVGP